MIHDVLRLFKVLPLASKVALAAALCLFVDLFLSWEQHCYHFDGVPTECIPQHPGRSGVVGVALMLTTALLIFREAAPLVRDETAERLMREAKPILGDELVARAPELLARIHLNLFVAGLVALKVYLMTSQYEGDGSTSVAWYEPLTGKAWVGIVSAALIFGSSVVRRGTRKGVARLPAQRS